MLGGPKAAVASPAVHPAVDLDLTRISNACGLATQGIIWLIFVLYLEYVSSPASEPGSMY